MTWSRPAAQSSRPPAASVRTPGAGRARLLVLALCATGGTLAALALPAVLGSTVDDLVARGDIVWTGLLWCTALTAAEVAFDAVVAVVGGTTTAQLTARLRTAAVDRVVRCDPRHGENVTAGDLTTRVTANAAESATVPVAAATAVPAVLLPVGGAVGLLLIDPWPALALLVAAPVLVVLLRTLVSDTARASADYQGEQAEIAGRLTEVLDGAATVRAAHTATREHARITAPLAALTAHGHDTWRAQGRAAAGAAALLPLLTAVVLAVAGIRTAAGALSIGDLLAVTQYAVLALGFGPLTGTLSTIARGRAATRRLEPMLALEPVPHRSLTLPAGGSGTLELRGVDVVRDGKRLLHGVDLTVPGGTCAAVVGRSGSGKSLLAAVAGRLTDPDAGSVTLDGVPLDGVDPVRLRDHVAYAFARPALLGTTVADAVGYGMDRPSGERIEAAVRDAGADAFVALLPHGARTALDRAPLSGGEYQRLGLARAFARPARLLILDDATSSLDTVTERQVQRALAHRAGTVTRLLVAHRVSTAAAADRVVWLDGGTVRAVAPHAVLWRDPAYRAVFLADPTDPDPDPDRDPGPGPDDPGPGSPDTPGPRPAANTAPPCGEWATTPTTPAAPAARAVPPQALAGFPGAESGVTGEGARRPRTAAGGSGVRGGAGLRWSRSAGSSGAAAVAVGGAVLGGHGVAAGAGVSADGRGVAEPVAGVPSAHGGEGVGERGEWCGDTGVLPGGGVGGAGGVADQGAQQDDEDGRDDQQGERGPGIDEQKSHSAADGQQDGGDGGRGRDRDRRRLGRVGGQPRGEVAGGDTPAVATAVPHGGSGKPPAPSTGLGGRAVARYADAGRHAEDRPGMFPGPSPACGEGEPSTGPRRALRDRQGQGYGSEPPRAEARRGPVPPGDPFGDTTSRGGPGGPGSPESRARRDADSRWPAPPGDPDEWWTGECA
ncbi:ABC transporter ATP-binding protein [Streptomyces yaizuensis]|uniref:ABC transporter ATP-binding protein n=1 Tax=Streptomyces yaizuensis TaxID=2989713 RepID=A0ABQ5P621_9ACTN|nr:ABC transporter ATP-binding protein [Streptomyces sp. YSPA8]GLF97913.1 hypothetical protein SYYSPA8_26470 [Streptomyces sp. YSPA8]